MANGIIIRKDLVESLWKTYHPTDKFRTYTRTQLITAVMQVNWQQITSLPSHQIPYLETGNADTFVYSNQAVRTHLEDLGRIVDLGALINACIASTLNMNANYRFATPIKTKELVQILELRPTIQEIATNLGQPGIGEKQEYE